MTKKKAAPKKAIKKKTIKKAAKKKAAKKAAAAVKKFKAVCDDEGINLTGWVTDKEAAERAIEDHEASFPNHACDILEK